MSTTTESKPARESKTRILFDLEDELTEEEIDQFEKEADEAGARSLTEHFLNLTLRAHSGQAA